MSVDFQKQQALLADLHRRAQREGMELEIAIMRRGGQVFVVSRHDEPEVRRLVARVHTMVGADVDLVVPVDMARDGDVS